MKIRQSTNLSQIPDFNYIASRHGIQDGSYHDVTMLFCGERKRKPWQFISQKPAIQDFQNGFNLKFLICIS